MEALVKTLRNLQVITLALVAGLMMLTAVMIYMVAQVKPGGFIGVAGPQLGGWPLMTTVLDGVSILTILLAVYLPPIFLKQTVGQWSKEAQPLVGDLTSWEASDLTWLNRVPKDSLNKLLMAFQTNRIVAVALCEAAGMISGVAYLLEANPISLVLMGMAIGLMIWNVPTQTSLSAWVFAQMEKLKREK
jgi:hypothetical protein